MEPRILLTEMLQFSITGGGTVTEDPADTDGNDIAFNIGYTGTLSGNESASVNVAHVLGQTNSADYTTSVVSAMTSAAANTPGVTFDGTTLTFGPAAGTSTTSAKYAGSAVDAAGTGDATWTNITAATGSAVEYASSTLDYRDYTNELRLTNFGFNIPVNATVNGITVTVNTTGSNDNMSGPGVKLTKTGAVAVGVAPPSTSNWSSGTVVVGNSAALWGATWTPAEINSASFGTILKVRSDDDGYQFRVVSALISVSYTTPSAPAPSNLSFTAHIADDTLAESTEAFSVTLTNAITTSPNGAAISAPTASASIIDNDSSSVPVVSITTATAAVSESATDAGVFTITRTGSTADALTVTFAVSGTATNGLDYSEIAVSPTTGYGSVTIPAGQASVPISMAPTPDNIVESLETVSITLNSASDYTVDPVSGSGVINIEDSPSSGDSIVFSISGNDTVTEDPLDSDNNQATYTVGYTGSLSSGQTASVNLAQSFNQTSASDYSTDVLAAVNATVATTPGVSFDGTTLTFGGTVPTATSASGFAGTATTAIGTGDVPWGSISGAAGSSPADYAMAQIDNHDVSDQLRLTNYGFSIPANAIISGITATVNTTGSGTNRGTPGIALTKNGISAAGFPPNSATTWNSGTVIVGSSTSVWSTDWQPSEINSGNFGLIIQVESSQNGAEFRVASAEIVVSYTVLGGTAPSSLTFTVGIADDAETEPSEAFDIVLSNPSTDDPAGAVLGTASVTTTIVDDDSAAAGGTGSGGETGDGTGSGGTGSEFTTGTGTGTGSGTGSGTSTGTSTTIDTSAADAAFSQAVLGAVSTYTTGLNNATAAREAADTQSFNTFLEQLDAADLDLMLADLDSKSTYDDAIADADQTLAAANTADWNQFEFLMSFLDEDWLNSVFDARQTFNGGKAAALAVRDAADLVSFNTLTGVFDSADATLAAARGAAAAIRDAAISAANAFFDQTVATATAVFDAAHNAYLAAHGYGEIGDDGSPSLYATLQTDSQYQSDMAAISAAYDSAVAAAYAAYESAWDAAKQTYDDDIAAATATHEAIVAANESAFFDAMTGIVADYSAAAADHAATADAAIATATTTRDAAFADADSVYDAAVAIAAADRAAAKADHDAAYAAGEEPAWQQLQSALTANTITHDGAVATATTVLNGAWDNAWTDYDSVADNPSSTPSQLNAALAARIVALAAAVANYNNAVAAADAAKTNADADAWAAYDTTVNGLITVYLDAEAQADAQETHALNAAYVVWANAIEAARSEYSEAMADAEAERELADAQSANDAWHDVNAEVKAWEIADANEMNAYSGDLTGLEATFIVTIEPDWVTLANALADADAVQEVAAAGAHFAAVGRWAGTLPGDSPLAPYMTAYEAAVVARTGVTSAARTAYAHAANAAEAAWTATVIPAWVTFEDEVTDHTAAAETTIAGLWETFQNAVDDADLTYTTEAVPLWQGLITDLNANYTAWVNDTADAEQTYGDELADNAVAWVEDMTAAEEAWANETLTHWDDYVHTTTALYVAQIGTIGTALNGWAATVAAQISAVSGTTVSVGSLVSTGGTTVASQSFGSGSGGTSGNGWTWYKPWTWMNPWFNQANLDDAELAEYDAMTQEESNILLDILNRTGVSYPSLDEVPDQVFVDLYGMTPAQAATVRSPRRLQQEAIGAGERALGYAENSLYVAAAADSAALVAVGVAAAAPVGVVIASKAEAVTAFGGEAAFGRLIGLGRGAADALARAQTITLEQLQAAGISLPVARYWLQFYQDAVNSGRGTDTAPARVILFQRIVDLLGG